MAVVAQLVRALVCGAGGRGFEPHRPPLKIKPFKKLEGFFYVQTFPNPKNMSAKFVKTGL